MSRCSGEFNQAQHVATTRFLSAHPQGLDKCGRGYRRDTVLIDLNKSGRLAATAQATIAPQCDPTTDTERLRDRR